MEVHLINGEIIKNVTHIDQLNGEFIIYHIVKSLPFTSKETTIKAIEIDSIEIK